MEIYIASSGEYSDYNIEGVFTDKKQAELYCATHGCRLETYEADETRIETEQKPKYIWFCGKTWRGDFVCTTYREMTLKDIFIESSFLDLKISLDADLEDEKAKKILKDKYMQWKAEKENI